MRGGWQRGRHWPTIDTKSRWGLRVCLQAVCCVPFPAFCTSDFCGAVLCKAYAAWVKIERVGEKRRETTHYTNRASVQLQVHSNIVNWLWSCGTRVTLSLWWPWKFGRGPPFPSFPQPPAGPVATEIVSINWMISDFAPTLLWLVVSVAAGDRTIMLRRFRGNTVICW